MRDPGSPGLPRPAPAKPAAGTPPRAAASPAAPPVRPSPVQAPPTAARPAALPPAKPTSQPVAAGKGPNAIPMIKWSSAPPPIPPRSFSTPPPPPPSSPTLVTEPPPPAPIPQQMQAHGAHGFQEPEEEDEPTRIQPDDIRRAVEIREDARVLLREALDEALAPLHYAVRDFERRLDALESAAARAPAPPPQHEYAHAPPPPVAPAQAPRAIPPPASVIVQNDPRDPFGSVVMASEVVTIPPAPRAPVMDWETSPFDGARRRRRVVVLFGLLVVIVFGALFGALIWSRVS
jgi:hypothetical protein